MTEKSKVKDKLESRTASTGPRDSLPMPFRLGTPRKTIEQLAAEQGIKPFDFEEAWQAAEGIWPKNESADDFTDWLRRERNESARESRFD